MSKKTGGEVGSSSRDGFYAMPAMSGAEHQAENIYVLPLLEEVPGDDFRLLILADGNNRAGIGGKTYDDGGKNVVNIARYLAESGGVSLMVACILSPYNLEKRGGEFFCKLYKAFVGLGVRMETQGFLVNDGIRLEFYGDLEKLARHSSQGAAIVQMIPWLSQKTAGITNPKLRLVLALSYDESIAHHFGVHMIFRSGLEERNSFRSSGIQARANTVHAGSQTLWPDVQEEDIRDAIDAARQQICRTFSPGYTFENMKSLVKDFSGMDLGMNVTLTFPYSGDMPEAVTYFSRETPELVDGSLSLTFFDESGNKIADIGTDDTAGKKIQIVPHTFSAFPEDEGNTLNDFSYFLAPGQTGEHFLLPPFPRILNATVLGCDAQDIIAGVGRAVNFSIQHRVLRGSERKLCSAGKIDAKEKKSYQGLEAKQAEGDSYNAAADTFVENMMSWTEDHSLPMDQGFQCRAVVNYYLTCFFMLYCPEHKNWKEFEPQWEETAQMLAKYMGLVYLGDESVFDLEPEGETMQRKRGRLASSSRYLKSALRQGSVRGLRVPNVPNKRALQTIAHGWVDDFIRPCEKKSHPVLFQKWRDALVNLYSSSMSEWEEKVGGSELVDRLDEDYSEASSQIQLEFFEKMPTCVKTQLSLSLDGYPLMDAASKKLTGYELELYTYLVSIMDSIGAGLAFRTVALTLKPETVDDEMIHLLDEICALSNFYYRIKNDVGGYLSRGEDDVETKRDSLGIACDYFSYKGSLAPVFAIADLKKRCNELKKCIVLRTAQLKDKSPRLAMAVSRAFIAEDIYDGGHYRTRTRQEMSQIFLKNRMSGVD